MTATASTACWSNPAMSNRRLHTLDHYRYSTRGMLVPGDRFRVRGGPVYVTDDGITIPLADHGVFVFRRYCIQGAARWLEAYRADGGGLTILWVGKASRSKAIPNLRRRPYRVVRVSDPQPTRRKR
jgi:hypothetical protein